MEISRSILVAASLLALSYVSVSAQQVTGIPGSPEATTTIPG
jgi:arylsulfatase